MLSCFIFYFDPRGGGVTCHVFEYGRAAGVPETQPIHILPISKIDPIHILFFKFYPFIYFLGEKDTPLIYFWCKIDTYSYTCRPEQYTPSSRTSEYTFIIEVTPMLLSDKCMLQDLKNWVVLLTHIQYVWWYRKIKYKHILEFRKMFDQGLHDVEVFE